MRAVLLVHQLHDGGAMLRVDERGDIAARLVEHVVLLLLWTFEELAVDADVILPRVGFGAELGDGGAVDLHTAFEDDLLGFAAAGDAGLGEDLLEALASGVRFFGLHRSIIAQP